MSEQWDVTELVVIDCTTISTGSNGEPTMIYANVAELSASYEGSLPEIALSGASKLASTYFTLFYGSVHVLYTEITYDTTRLQYDRNIEAPIFPMNPLRVGMNSS